MLLIHHSFFVYVCMYIVCTHVCENFALLLVQIPNSLYRCFLLSVPHIYDIDRDREWAPYASFLYPLLSNTLGKLQEITFSIHRGQWPVRFDQPRSAKGAKSERGNKTNPVHASGRIKIPLVSAVRISEIPERRRVSCARSRLLCAFEHVMIAGLIPDTGRGTGFSIFRGLIGLP